MPLFWPAKQTNYGQVMTGPSLVVLLQGYFVPTACTRFPDKGWQCQRAPDSCQFWQSDSWNRNLSLWTKFNQLWPRTDSYRLVPPAKLSKLWAVPVPYPSLARQDSLRPRSDSRCFCKICPACHLYSILYICFLTHLWPLPIINPWMCPWQKFHSLLLSQCHSMSVRALQATHDFKIHC